MFCRHDWELLIETVTKSKFESSMEILSNFSTEKIKLPPQMSDSERKHIQVFVCRKCGKLERFVEEI